MIQSKQHHISRHKFTKNILYIFLASSGSKTSFEDHLYSFYSLVFSKIEKVT